MILYLQFVILAYKKSNQMFCSAAENQPASEQNTVKKIGSYLFRYSDVLGSGNFSTVYSGVDQNTGKQVAIKVVKVSTLKSKTAQKLLQNQISILKDLDHHNVIKCFDQLTSINNCYIITQLCLGDLDKVLKKKNRFQEKQISKWILDILKGLQYLQTISVIHRDLKVSNIFLSSNGSAKIADFGFAIRAQQKFKDLSIGSPIYMSPQGLIYNQYGPKTDIWSLGIVIYELLHGQAPLECCHSEIQLKKKVIQPPIFKVKISNQLRKFIQNCLRVNQSQRFTISQLMETTYVKKIKCQIQGSKVFKGCSSGFNSTYNSTTQFSSISQNFNKFQVIDEINYDTAVSILHYCRLVHKTCLKIKSQILSQWLLNISFGLLKSKISKNQTDKQQYEKLKEVIAEYHNKYKKQHQDFRTEILISDVLKQCDIIQKFSEVNKFTKVLLKQTRLLKQCLQRRKLEDFGSQSESKKYLSNLPNNITK